MRRTSSTVDWIAGQLSSCSSLCLIVLPCALPTTLPPRQSSCSPSTHRICIFVSVVFSICPFGFDSKEILSCQHFVHLASFPHKALFVLYLCLISFCFCQAEGRTKQLVTDSGNADQPVVRQCPPLPILILPLCCTNIYIHEYIIPFTL